MEVVFGGSFNPPTVAHYEIIKALSKKYDKVLILPNGKSYGRKTLIDDSYRLDMINLMVKDFDNVFVSTYEMENKFSGTYKTLRDLNHPVFVCGDDWIDNLHTWIGAQELVSENKFLVLTRNKKEEDILNIIENSTFLKPFKDHFEVMKLNFPNVSSKKFRNEFDKTQVLDSVFEYIKQNRLYKEDSMFANNYLKVALASPKVSLGKPLENAKTIMELANENKDAGIIVFPEMSLTGYTIYDWVLNQELLTGAKLALKHLVDNSSKQILVVGMPFEVSGRLYNTGVVIQNQKILGIVPKVSLNESFDKRVFTEGINFTKEPANVNIFGQDVPFGQMLFLNEEHNVSFGLEISDDLLGFNAPYHELYKNGADIVLNLGSSPFYLGYKEKIENAVKNAATTYSGAYLYTSINSSETASNVMFVANHIAYMNDTLLQNIESYDFNSLVTKVDVDLESIKSTRYLDKVNKNPTLIDMIVSNFELNETTNYILEKLPDPYPFIPKTDKECEEIINIVTTSLKHRLDYIGIKKVVIGISGGLDSTLALLFAYSTYKKYNMDPKNIVAITMPGFGTGSKSKSIATNLMDKLEVDARNISIKKEAQLHLKLLEHDLEKKDVTYENVQARLRTLLLMNTANKEAGIVIGTGDMSEIALGWSTFNGDQMSMYNVNAGLPKTTIKALVNYYIKVYPELKTELKKVYGAVISPELTGSDQSTEDRLGKYIINDFIMYHAFVNGASKKRIVYLLENVHNLEHVIACNYYDNFFKRFNRNQYKRLASPEGVRVFKLTLSPHGGFKYPGDMK